MTAKEELIGIIEGWSEDEAEKWLSAIEPERSHPKQPKFLTATEILRLPSSRRDAVIAAQLAHTTPADIELQRLEVEEWEIGTAGDIDLIDD